MKLYKGKLLLTIAVLCMPLLLIAQAPVIPFKHITTANGLSQSSVIAIAQDHQGMLWFGTRDGLNRYDGNKIKVFRNDPNNENSISNNDILDLAVDKAGNLWIATYNGLNKYDLESEKFTRYLSSDENQLSNNTIWSIDIKAEDQILLGTFYGLNILNPATGIFQHYFHDPFDSTSISHNHVLDIFTDSKNQTWVGTENGFNRMVQTADGSFVFELIPLNTKKNTVALDFVQAIGEDANNRIWIGTKYNGLYGLSMAGKIEHHFVKGESPENIVDNNVRALAVDLEKRLWVGTYSGVSRMEPDGKFTTAQNIMQIQNSLYENKVKSVFCSNKGSVWIGTYYGGVNMWDEANFNFNTIRQQGNNLGLANNVVSAIVEDDRYLYFATEAKGISARDKKTNRFTYFDITTTGLRSNNVKSLRWNDSTNELWVCTLDAGLNIFNPHLPKEVKVIDVKAGLSHISVYDVVSTNTNQWLIATFGGGLNLYDPSTQEIKWIKNDPSNQRSLTDDQVRVLLKDTNGNIWIGTQHGLNFLAAKDLASGVFTFTRYLYDEDTKSGKDILCIAESADHTIWVGTKEAGLHKYVGDKFIPIDLFKSDDSRSKGIQAIEEDSQHSLWMSSSNGIIRYHPKRNQATLFEESDGLVSNEFNNSASAYSSNGILFFGGPHGVTWFRPEALRANSYTPDVLLTGLKINGARITPGDQTGVLSKTLARAEQIQLDYDQANFTLEFALPSFVNPGKNQFVYRMKGLEEEWNQSPSTEVSYVIQNPGTYLFEIKGINNDGHPSESLTQLQVVVRPAPWRSAWAFLLYGFIIAVALFGWYRMIKSKARLKYELDLEHTINLQQQELNQNKLQFFTNISHEFRTPLTLILGPLEDLIQDFRGSSVVFRKFKVMQQSASQLLKLVNQLMDFRKIENQQATLEAAEGNIVKFVYEIFLSFKILANTGNYSYTFDKGQEVIKMYYDRDKLERVVYNLLSNAFKFTPEGGSIHVSVMENANAVEICIRDSGLGIQKENIDKIFDRFYQVPAPGYHTEKSRGTGIGLALAKGIVDLHKGNLSVKSEVSKGSEFSIALKKGTAHLEESQIIRDFKDSEDLTGYQTEANDPAPKRDFDINRFIRNENRETILVTEDNEQVRNFIVELLSDEYNVLEAQDGQEGIQIATNEVPDLIISDVMMPVMDGIEFCFQVKNNLKTSHIPFVLLTARTSLIFKYEGLESGANEYITKPFNVRELKLKVKNLLLFVGNLKKKFRDNNSISPGEVTITSMDEALLRKAIGIVDGNIENEFFDVAFFAEELAVSRTMLFTKIKAWTGMTPNDFILSMRMKRAAQLLEQGKLNISQICYKVGFKNPKYFTKCFTKYYGVSPTTYASKFENSDSTG